MVDVDNQKVDTQLIASVISNVIREQAAKEVEDWRIRQAEAQSTEAEAMKENVEATAMDSTDMMHIDTTDTNVNDGGTSMAADGGATAGAAESNELEATTAAAPHPQP